MFNVHVHSVDLKVWSVKCSQITKFTLAIHALEPQINQCYGELENKKIHANGIKRYKKTQAMVFTATSKLMLNVFRAIREPMP